MGSFANLVSTLFGREIREFAILVVIVAASAVAIAAVRLIW